MSRLLLARAARLPRPHIITHPGPLPLILLLVLRLAVDIR